MTVKTTQKFMTANDCYKSGRTITVKGLMVHSTATPGVMATRWFDLWNKAGIEKGVHGFLDNKEFYQYLPWNRRGWHCGGAGNNTHIGIEWCEPKDLNDKTYLDEIWVNGVELYASLCKQFNLTEKDIIAHYEGYKLGIASNHGDPAHWWKLHEKTMDMFRDDVSKALKGVTNGWKQENGKWYFYKNGCLVKSEWVKHTDSKWYYLKTDGVMADNEWVKDKDKWYFLASGGGMKTGLIEDKGKLYFLQKDGSMLANGRINVTVNVGKDGSLHP